MEFYMKMYIRHYTIRTKIMHFSTSKPIPPKFYLSNIIALFLNYRETDFIKGMIDAETVSVPCLGCLWILHEQSPQMKKQALL